MQFKSIALALLGVTGLMAHPFNEREVAKTGAFVEINRKPASDGKGNLIFFGPGSKGTTKRVDTNLFEKRQACHSSTNPTPQCATDNTARNEICENLVNELYGDSTTDISGSAQQICYQGDAAESNSYCCISWKRKILGLHKGDFSEIAASIARECTENGISGRVPNVYVHSDACTDVCMSNRGTDC